MTAELVRARLVGVDLDVVADAVGREEAQHAPGAEQPLPHDPLEQALGIREQAARRLARLRDRPGWRDSGRPAPRSGRTASSRSARPAPRADSRRRRRTPGSRARAACRPPVDRPAGWPARVRDRLPPLLGLAGCRARVRISWYSARDLGDELVPETRRSAGSRPPRPRGRHRARGRSGPGTRARSSPRCAPGTSWPRRSAAAWRIPRAPSRRPRSHLLQRRRDEPAQADDVHLLRAGRSPGSWRTAPSRRGR